jgi:thiol-disulfide isomerase/thioredoxin
MRAIRWAWLPGLLGLLAVAWPAALAQPPAQEKAADAKVELKVVKYDQLGDTVRQLRGKVVLVDFWGIDCVPCKKAFPHLIEMQRQYGKDGFAAVSVAVRMREDDEPFDKEQQAVQQFLREKNATLTNLMLNEKSDVVLEKLRFSTLPCAYVFNREGKWYQFKDDFQYADVEKLVVDLLKKQ